MLVMLTLHPDAVPVPTVIVPAELPTVGHHAALPAGAGLTQLVLVVYLIESAKYASSAVTMFRRSDFIEEMYAFSIVLANFGIAMAARMPVRKSTRMNSRHVTTLCVVCCSCWCWMRQRVSNRPQMLQPICL